MSEINQFLLITFKTTHLAVSAEKELKSQGEKVDLIPVPRGISSECGFCLKLDNCQKAFNFSYENIWLVSERKIDGKKEKKYERIA